MNESIDIAASPIGVIPLDVFNVQVGVFARDDTRCAWLKEHGCAPTPTAAPAFATAHKDYDDDGRAYFSMVIGDDALPGTWAHECVHIADWVMDHLGIPCTVENTEVRGYTVGHLFESLCKILHDRDAQLYGWEPVEAESEAEAQDGGAVIDLSDKPCTEDLASEPCRFGEDGQPHEIINEPGGGQSCYRCGLIVRAAA